MYEPDSIEAIGLNVEDAVARGLEALNAKRDEVIIDVIDPGGRPAPGQRPREARVRLTLKPAPAPAPKPAQKPAPAPRVASSGQAPARGSERAAPARARGPEKSVAADERVTPVPEKAAPAGEKMAPVPEGAEGEMLALAQTVLQEMLDKLHVKGRVAGRFAEAVDEQDEEEGPPIVLDIRGDDLGVLIGRRGETLTALQYLTRLIVGNKASRNVNLIVDVEGYKARREQQLRQLAARMAERVATTRKPVALEPMPAYERRIIHLALRDHPVVTTESVGRDEERKVTIILKSRRRS